MSRFSDLRLALRTLNKAPLASSVAILALALGIGANVSAFIALNSIVLHPLPFANLDRILTIWQTDAKTQLNRRPLSPADYLDLQAQATSFQSVAACRPIQALLHSGSATDPVRVAQVSPAFFAVLSAHPAQGHFLSNRRDAVVVSDAFWKGRFAAASDIIGKRLALSTGVVTVEGVMPDDFDYPLGTEVWTPLDFTAAQSEERAIHDLNVIALLRSGVSERQATLETATIAARLAANFPTTDGGGTFDVVSLRNLTGGVTNRFVALVLVCAGFVLLLACANVGNLQLARATQRQKEMAVRAALGASRAQLARPVVMEILLLSLAAGVLAVLLADWNNFFTKQDIPAIALRLVPGLRTMKVDPSVLFFAFALSLLAGLICSLPAIVHLARRSSADGFDESLRERASLGGHRSAAFLRSGLIVSEIALALVLLIGAGLMAGTLQRMLNLNQGFNPKGVLTAGVSLPPTSYNQPLSRLAYFDRAVNEVSAIPGVSAAALSSSFGPASHFAIEGRPEIQPGALVPEIMATSQQYWPALEVRLLKGRALAAVDTAQSARVIVISQVLAKAYWPDSDPIGHRIQWQKGGDWFTVVGVSADVIHDWFLGKPSPVAYVSYAQAVPTSCRFFVRVQGSPLNSALSVHAKLQAIDSSVPIFEMNAYDRALAEERSGVRAAARTMALYAGIALLLSVSGIYALVSYLVSLRTRDIGIHLALGAPRAAVIRLTTSHTGKLVLIGIGIGLTASVILTRLMSHVLFDVVQLDAPLWVLLTGLLMAAAFVAAGLPALRATAIDPVSALRHE